MDSPPSSEAFAVMSPPCARAILVQIDSPSPAPPVSRPRDFSTLKSRLNSSGKFFSSTPGALSLKVIETNFPLMFVEISILPGLSV